MSVPSVAASLQSRSGKIAAAVLLASLGYFVDIYDLILFSIVRVKSLTAIGVPDGELLSQGVFLLNMQMGGMLLGGILWGILGDKKGRLSVLFGSILLYSVANLANAFVGSVPVYAALRLVAGIGLAGELGAGITLVSEMMSKENRGYGTMIVAAVGILGAVAACIVGDLFDWRVAYAVGGVLGLLLLFLRIGVYESGMFQGLKQAPVRRGDLRLLFTSRERALRYLNCILIGVPVWFVIGILITLSPELGKAMDMAEAPQAGRAVLFCYSGLAAGDFLSGYLSQRFKSRKKVVGAFQLLSAALTAVYLLSRGVTPGYLYGLCFALGVATGYWAVFVTIAAEQFGTNIRATVTTTAPNFVRGSLVLLNYAFLELKPRVGTLNGAGLVGAAAFLLAFTSLVCLRETYGKDLDYTET